MFKSAREMGISIWSHEIAGALTRSETALVKLLEDGQENSQEYLSLTTVITHLRSALRQVWKPTSTDVFNAE